MSHINRNGHRLITIRFDFLYFRSEEIHVRFIQFSPNWDNCLGVRIAGVISGGRLLATWGMGDDVIK